MLENDVSLVHSPSEILLEQTSFTDNVLENKNMALRKLFSNLAITKQFIKPAFLGVNHQIVRTTFKFVDKPKPDCGRQFRREVYFPKDGIYTVMPLKNRHLAGRDPDTGRKIVQGLGGGVKHMSVNIFSLNSNHEYILLGSFK